MYTHGNFRHTFARVYTYVMDEGCVQGHDHDVCVASTYVHTYVGECEVVLPLSAHSNVCTGLYLHNFTPFYMAC